MNDEFENKKKGMSPAGIIALALVLHAWRRQNDRARARAAFRGEGGAA